jgi:parvulin-like peptidyl-prolyl isomerase
MSRCVFHAGLVGAVAAFCLAVGYSAGAQETEPKETPNSLLPGQVMKVGDTVITSEQLLARIWDAEVMVEADKRELPKELTYLRDTALLDLEARRLGGFAPTDAEIETETKSQIETLKALIKEKTRGTHTYEDWLKEQGMSVEEFEAYIFDRARVIIMRRVLVRYFEETEPSIDCSHILVNKLERAKDLHKRLKESSAAKLTETFEDLAVQHSEDPAAGVTQGRLPRIYENDGTLVKEAAGALWALKDGEFSEPVKTDYGYHIFMRHKTYTPKKRPLADMRAELIKAPTRQNEEDYFNRWVRWVFNTQKYKVERRLPGYDCKPDQRIQEKK